MIDANFIADPYPTYRAMRAAGPVHWAPEFFGGSWLLTHYSDVIKALRDPRLSAQRSRVLVEQFPEPARSELAEFDQIFSRWMLFQDNPEHGRLRKLLNRGFNQHLLQRMRPRVQQLINELIDQFDTGEPVNFMRQFAHPLPAIVIAEVLGVDVRDRGDFIVWSDALAEFFGDPAPTLDGALAAQAGLVALQEYFRAVLPGRRRDPGEDVVSLLLAAEEDGDVLTTEELLAQCTLLLSAGHETTRNLLGNGLLALLRNPTQLELLRADPSLMRDAVKELLRYDSPVQFVGRVAAEDFELHGHTIRKGQAVLALTGSANRDEQKFNDPDKLDLRRDEGPHVSFGYGAHVCLGATLSYLQGEVAMTTILARFPRIELMDPTPRWCPNPGFRGVKALTLGLVAASVDERVV